MAKSKTDRPGNEAEPLRIDWGLLETAYDLDQPGARYYLDRVSGEVLLVSEEALFALERESEATGWTADEVVVARQVQEATERFLLVPRPQSEDEDGDRDAFIEQVGDERLRARLARGFDGKGSFLDLLGESPRDEERWYAFRARQRRQRLLAWLAESGMSHEAPPELPSQEDVMSEETLSTEDLLDELTLVSLFLSSWEEKEVLPGLKPRRAWKGHLFEVLDTLEEKGWVNQSRRAKSLTLTDDGVKEAQRLVERYRNR